MEKTVKPLGCMVNTMQHPWLETYQDAGDLNGDR